MAPPSDLPQATATDDGIFPLELLHLADQEASSAAVADAPSLSAVLNALRAQYLGGDGLTDNTLTLSSGDAFIPGVFFDASEAVFGAGGIADIQIQNELGLSAIALGNHEFDFGTAVLADLIDGRAGEAALGSFAGVPDFEGTDLDGVNFAGTAFPYLSSNLDFSTDANLCSWPPVKRTSPKYSSIGAPISWGISTEGIRYPEVEVRRGL